MNRPQKDHELLFGVVAVSKQFLKPEELVDATIAWSQDGKNRSLVNSLLEQGLISEDERATVDSIVADDSKDDSLAEILGAADFHNLRQALQHVDDDEVGETLDRMIIADDLQRSTVPLPPIASEQQRFEIRRELARGGLGEVFVAHDKQLNRDVALKQIQERLSSHLGANERFLLEAEVTGRLEHPGVVPVYALGQKSDGQYYYTMRLIRGVTLENQIESYFQSADQPDPTAKNLELRALLRRFIDVCNTIDYAHSRGVIHRDLKPANIMLGKYGETLVVDWGLAKQVGVEDDRGIEDDRGVEAESLLLPESGSGSADTQFGSAIGTPQYMSPEQAAGRLDQIGPASDVYSLGATLFQMLTSRPPHEESSQKRLLEKIKHGDIPNPRSVRPDVPKPLGAICLKAMRLRVTDRYRSAGEMAGDIERWLADQRVEAYREPRLATVGRSLRRHQTLTATSTVVTILLCVAAVAGLGVSQRSQARERMHAEEIGRQEFRRVREDEQQLEQRRSSADANLRLGLAEAAEGRFGSAFKFFQQGEQACADEPRLDGERTELSARSQQMDRLVKFWQLTDEGTYSLYMDEQQRGLQLCAQGLRRLGIFEHADWWDHLPVDGLSSRDVDRIEISANFQLALLSTFLGQGLASVDTVALRALGLPLKHTEQRDRQFMLAYRTADMALAYRPSQWTSHLKEIGRYMQSSRSTMPTRPQWRGDNYIDAVIFGQMSLMLSYSGEGGIARAFMDQIFGLAGTSIEARRYAVRSTELDPLNSNARTSLGWIEHRIGNYDAARNNFTNAIALRPDLVVNYVLRSNTLLSQSMNTDDAVERRRLQYLALDDAIIARELAPDREMVHWASGNALRQLGKHSQAVASYLAAIDREPPVDMVPLSKFQFLLQGRDPKRVRRLSYWLADRFDAVQTYVRQLQMDEPDNSQFMLLQAAVALELQEYEDARMAAERMLEISEQDPNLASSIVGHAHAIIGETHRHKQQWQQAKDAFARSSQNDPINSLATVGLAAMLEQLATATKDAVDFELALAAYDKLARIAFTDWQSVRAQAGRFRILVDLDRMDEASIAVNLLLDADRGYDLSPLLEFAEDRDAAPVLEKLRSLRIDVQLEQAVADQQPARTLPLRNGHFELGLSAYWEPWSTEGQCLAETTIDDTSPRPDSNGVASLLIQHESAATPGARGVLEQTLPAMPDKRFRVSLWAKSRQSTAGGTQIVVDDAWDVPTIELPGGSYDWQEFSGEFIATAKSNYADQPGLTKIKIVSTAPGEVWIDDIRIEQVVE